MNTLFRPLLSGLLILLVSGCGTNTARISGVIRFSNGTTLDSGNVVMLREGKPAQRVYGGIASDGTFKVGLYREGDKCPTGTYKVYLLNTSTTQVTTKIVTERGRSYESGTRKTIQRVAPAFTASATTPLVVEIKRGKNKLDIVLEEP